LPPLAKQVSTVGNLDPDLLPAMEVCELDGNPSAVANPGGWESVGCTSTVVAYFAPGSAEVVPYEHYAFSWDTDQGPENLLPMDPLKFYRITILLEEAVLGYLDVNPQQPSGESPGEDYPDLYAFRIGETLPVKVFLTVQARCATAEDYVIQCIAQGVIDAAGGVVTLEPEQEGWARLSVVVPPDALPAGYPTVILTMERIDPDLFLAATGEHCIPGLAFLEEAPFDQPLVGDCLRVTTEPEVTIDLEYSAFIEMCIEPEDYGLSETEETRLQILRYEDGVWEGLPNVDATTCGTPALPSPSQVGLLTVPDDGLLRHAAIGVNHLARWLGPEPVAAHGKIRLAGATSEFSRFQWGLPGEMIKLAGDNTVIQQLEDGSESYEVTATVKVMDAGTDDLGLPSEPVEGATVHFSGAASVIPTDVTTLADGLATVLWTVPNTPGVHTLAATALGLLSYPVPDHQYLIEYQQETEQFTATVVGGPSFSTQSPPGSPPLVGAPGETLSTPLVITVVDENQNPVVGWDVTWVTTCSAPDPATCDGDVAGDALTDASGQATGIWTLATVPGSQTATAYVGDVSIDFVAGLWNANAWCQVVVDGVKDDASGEWDCAEAAGNVGSFTANISGGDTEAEVWWQNDAADLYLMVRVRQPSFAKANSIRFDFDNLGDGVHDPYDDAIGYDVDGDYFFDEYLTAKCANNSQSGCGATDDGGAAGQSGNADAKNDGTWTTYELSHPLTGGGVQDIDRAPGDPLGFFLTLRVGNGAQGNTQFPGFRQFLTITIQ
jgi:hypothetical protein